MKRIAVPLVGGMLSSTVLTLIVIPVIYAIVKSRAATECGAIKPSVPVISV
jgi:Cu(I)/Ag(I) efflux system membrane protein CusA/SilA